MTDPTPPTGPTAQTGQTGPAGPTSYRTIAAPVSATIEARRSRFLADLARAPTEEEARAVIDAARRAHHDARHHCSAFILGVDGRVERSNDDGDPSGTAGAPMLEVLRGSGLSDVVVVVTRWFGGTLLGTGGLIRAYSDAVAAALELARPLRRELLVAATLEVSHADAGRVEHELRAAGAQVEGVDYGQVATMHLAVAPDALDRLEELVLRLSGGQGRLVPGERRWVDCP